MLDQPFFSPLPFFLFETSIFKPNYLLVALEGIRVFSFYKCTSLCLTGHIVLALGVRGGRTEVHIKEMWFSKSVGRKDPKDLDLL